MRNFKSLSVLGLAFLLGITCNTAYSGENPGKNDVSLTIYNKNFALVKDYREINFKKGLNDIEVDDVAALIDPTSIHLKSPSAPNSIVVREQNYRYDLIDKSKILDKMVGKTIKFKNNNELKEGILLNPSTAVIRTPSEYDYSSNYNTLTASSYAIKTKEGILLTNPSDIIVDKLPEGLYARPTLVWKADSAKSGNQDIEIAYITEGVNWYTDYIAVIDNNDRSIDLTGWVTVNNNSGVSYNNASLKLVAGDVRRIQNRSMMPMMAGVGMAKAEMYSDAMRPQFNEESFFEYHLYTLGRKTDVRNNETKQLTLITADNVSTDKKYIYDPSTNYYYHTSPGSGRDTSTDKKINIILEVKNSKTNHLGIAMPKGKVRVYKKDSSGDLQFIGEDQIDHTPVDEKISLNIGDAFDIVGEKRKTNFYQSGDYFESTYECVIKNHKKEPVQVDIYEKAYGDWKITEKSGNYIKKDASTVVFPVNVPANGKTTITYTIRVKRL